MDKKKGYYSVENIMQPNNLGLSTYHKKKLENKLFGRFFVIVSECCENFEYLRDIRLYYIPFDINIILKGY